MLTVITGPNCSGKSTYARQHAKPGDIIIDFDVIAQAFGSPVTHGHDPQYWKVAIEARDAAIKAAVGLHHQGHRVWLIHGFPSQATRAYYQRQRARFVALDAPLEELHRRADADGRPPHYHALIDQGGAKPESAPGVEQRTKW